MAGQAEPHRECSMAVSGDRVAWCREQGFRPSGGDFQGIGVYRSDGCFGERRGTAPPRSGHRLDEPRQVIPRQWLHPCSACFRFAWRDHCNSGSGNCQPKSDLCDRVVDFVTDRKICCAPERIAIPLQGRASGSNDLPWAFPRVLQAIPKIKRAADANGGRAGHGPGGVCSKDVSSTFGRDMRGSAIAARRAGRRRGPGRGGKPRSDTGTRRPANSNGTGKAGAIGNVSGTENHQQEKPFRRPRG